MEWSHSSESPNKLINDINRANHDNSLLFDKELFNKMIIVWREFRDLKGEVDARSHKGGSIYSCIVSGSKTRTTTLLLEDLKQKFS